MPVCKMTLINHDPQEGDICQEEDCQACCPHSDARDHGICIDCGHEEDPGAAIDRAMDSMGDR